MSNSMSNTRRFFKNPWLNTRYFLKDPDSFVNGWYSNIPLCCVRFWIDNMHKPEFRERGFGEEMRVRRTGIENIGEYIKQCFDDDTDRFADETAHYVECDECWDASYVQKIRYNGMIILNPFWHVTKYWWRLMLKIGVIEKKVHTIWEHPDDLANLEIIFHHRLFLRKIGFNVEETPWGKNHFVDCDCSVCQEEQE